MAVSHQSGLSTFAWASLVTLHHLTSWASASAIPRAVTTSDLLSSYDYIIVGGGTSGLTVADRLTEDPAINVLVLEAGDWGIEENILSITYINSSDTNNFLTPGNGLWLPVLKTVPQARLNNGTEDVYIGNTVGGGSAVNGMMNMRGAKADYDRWGQIFEENGIESLGWSWDDMLPYFKKVSVTISTARLKLAV